MTQVECLHFYGHLRHVKESKNFVLREGVDSRFQEQNPRPVATLEVALTPGTHIVSFSTKSVNSSARGGLSVLNPTHSLR